MRNGVIRRQKGKTKWNDVCRHETGSDLGHFLNEVCIIIKYNESFRQEIKDAVIRKL